MLLININMLSNQLNTIHEWMSFSVWFTPTAAGNSCAKSCVVYCGSKVYTIIKKVCTIIKFFLCL